MTPITYPARNDDAIRALWTHPGADRAPAVLLIHEASGLDPALEDLGGRLATEGFAVLAPDLVSRAGASPVSDRRALADLEAGLRWMAGRDDVDADALAVAGFGAGGTLAFLLGCTSRHPAAVVDFWGPVIYSELSAERPAQPLELALNLSCPVLFHFGAGDLALPPDHVAALRTKLDQFAASFEIECWEGAGSGFLWSGRPGYHEASALAAWARTLRFLRDQFEID